MSYARIAYSPVGTFAQYATIKLGVGDWEITQLSVVMGSSEPALNGMEIGEGRVIFEVLDGDVVTQEHFLLSGRCTRWHPLVMDNPKRVKGPGRIRSAMIHLSGDIAHTLAANYRRVRD